MEKITFRVNALANSNSPKQIELKSVGRNGEVTWIHSSGQDYDLAAPLGVNHEPVRLSLASSERYVSNEAGFPTNKTRVFGVFTYVSEEDEAKLPTYERERNMVLRKAHLMLKTHQACVYRDKTGNDINPNRWGATVAFELVEESQNIKNLNVLNDKITNARTIAKELLEGSKDTFVDFCYAYGLSNVSNTPVEILYNEVCLKISINPDHFISTYESKNNQTLVIIRKSLEHLKEDNTTLISLLNNVYTMNGDILGDTEDAVVYHLNTHPKVKEYLMLQLGISPDAIVKAIELSPVSDHPTQSDSKKLHDKGLNEAAVAQMKTKVNFMFNKAKGAIAKDASKRSDILRALDNDINEKRSVYVEILPYYDDHVDNLMKNF